MQSTSRLISYATVIFSMAEHDEEMQKKFYDQIKTLDLINKSNVDFYNILSARVISKEERKNLAKEILSECNFDPIIVYWVWTIIDNNSYRWFHNIAIFCRQIYHGLFNIVQLKVTSAYKLDDKQVNKIKDFFEKKMKKKIDIEININQKLIGGLKIQVNNKIYDNSFEAKLDKLKKTLSVKKG